jgi:Na+-translocating ferredoxin:NAD+ oxidoreductase RNF subunit RnfB
MDCTGCAVCCESCPDDALEMKSFHDNYKRMSPHWDYSVSMPYKEDIVSKYSVKGS